MSGENEMNDEYDNLSSHEHVQRESGAPMMYKIDDSGQVWLRGILSWDYGTPGYK